MINQVPCAADVSSNRWLACCPTCAKYRWTDGSKWLGHEHLEDGFKCKAPLVKDGESRVDTSPIPPDPLFGDGSLNKTAADIGRTIGECDWRTEASLVEPGTLTRNDLLGWHRELCDQARDLMSQKNKDYASDADPLRNFRMSAQVAGITPEQCALIYLGENVAKFRSFIENGGKSYVAGEKFTDHLKDTINFLILLYAILVDKGYFKEKK